jgi:chaperonin GroES
VLVEPLDAEAKQTKSGIVIPDTVDKKKQSRGKVIASGPGARNEAGEFVPMLVRVGDNVLFKEPWSEESKIEDGDKKYFLVEESDILAIIENK